MSDTPGPTPNGATLELLQNQASQSRRVRPPDPETDAGYVDRVPLRLETDSKLRKRESRLGLRNIFGWHKSGATERTPPSPVPTTLPVATDIPQRQGGIRASLAEINWPYSLSQNGGQRSELALPSFSLPTASVLRHKKSTSVVRSQHAPINTRGSLATWDPPPLFKAYPQAIRHAHLPACTASAEVVLRLHRSGFSQSSLALDMFDESGVEKSDKAKKKHRRNTSGSSLKLEWTTKVFVFVTSGYLLQYSGDGSFDRLPEKVLQLGKDSAAFASDVIPGRHWVLQVSSVVEPDRNAASHATSLFSRLPFRGQDRRQAANLLMVFESAEEMDGWITTIRREIEGLGGRKYLSETGKPKHDDIETQLKSQTSQRTLVVRDPDRFSRVMSPELPWERTETSEIHLDIAETDARDQSFDDTSTASGLSHDGQQLDGLRDSTNRFSYISSGQRTVITSADSSPACSPIRDSFVSNDDGHISEMDLEDEPRPRARPNAAAINDRRQSLQTMNHLLEIRTGATQPLRPHSTAHANTWHADSTPVLHSQPQTIPNFSVPQGMGKRYSVTRPTPSDPLQNTAPTLSRMSSRRAPPTALAINGRPLSLVEDQPSPLSAPVSDEDALSSTGPDTPSMFSPWVEYFSDNRPGDSVSELSDLPQTPAEQGSQDNHRQKPLASSVRSLEKFVAARCRAQEAKFVLPDNIPPPPMSPAPQDIIRPKSSLDFYSRAQSPTPLSPNQPRIRRLSLYSHETEKPSFDLHNFPSRPRAPSLKPILRSSQHLRVDSLSKNLLQRRSLSQLAEGPPPGPPPTRALPPIPLKHSKSIIAPAAHD